MRLMEPLPSGELSIAVAQGGRKQGMAYIDSERLLPGSDRHQVSSSSGDQSLSHYHAQLHVGQEALLYPLPRRWKIGTAGEYI